MTITAVFNGVDFAPVLSTWKLTKEISYAKVVNSLDGGERAFGKRERAIITFSLLPFTEAENDTYYSALSTGFVTAKFTDSDGTVTTKEMRLTSNLESVFLLDSVDGQRRYKGGTITLRQLGVN